MLVYFVPVASDVQFIIFHLEATLVVSFHTRPEKHVRNVLLGRDFATRNYAVSTCFTDPKVNFSNLLDRRQICDKARVNFVDILF